MLLKSLIATARVADPDLVVAGATGIEIAALALDSRSVVANTLFAAFPGAKTDGRAFLPEAAAAGAVAVLVPADTATQQIPEGVTALVSADPRRVLAHLAAAFFAPLPKVLAAVTGTNGKTSIAEFTRQIWARAGHASASLGTLGVISQKGHASGSLTTPDVITLFKTLGDLARQGIDHAAIEASSHGLDQRRLDALPLHAAAFTNLTRDHLDYHHIEAAYLAAKTRLFDTVLPEGGTAVINADIPEAAALRKIAAARGLKVVDYGETAEAIRLVGRATAPEGQILDLRIDRACERVVLPLAGGFQAMNALAALGLALSTGISKDIALSALGHLKGAPGRLERRALREDGAAVYVDYAHTPDALETVLRALRPHTEGRLIVVFGCGGDRDRGKRPAMGAIAQDLADRVVVTDDNPRTEIAAAIRAEILKGCPGAKEIDDRALAIRTAMAAMDAGDVLLVAGKGHETGQIVGATVLPFDDRAVVDALSREIW